MKTTMAPELFFSSIIHGVFLYFILTLPLSNMGTTSFNTISVALITADKTIDSVPPEPKPERENSNDQKLRAEKVTDPKAAFKSLFQEQPIQVFSKAAEQKNGLAGETKPVSKKDIDAQPEGNEKPDELIVTKKVKKESIEKVDVDEGTVELTDVTEQVDKKPEKFIEENKSESLPVAGNAEISESPYVPEEPASVQTPQLIEQSQLETPVPEGAQSVEVGDREITGQSGLSQAEDSGETLPPVQESIRQKPLGEKAEAAVAENKIADMITSSKAVGQPNGSKEIPESNPETDEPVDSLTSKPAPTNEALGKMPEQYPEITPETQQEVTEPQQTGFSLESKPLVPENIASAVTGPVAAPSKTEDEGTAKKMPPLSDAEQIAIQRETEASPPVPPTDVREKQAQPESDKKIIKPSLPEETQQVKGTGSGLGMQVPRESKKTRESEELIKPKIAKAEIQSEKRPVRLNLHMSPQVRKLQLPFAPTVSELKMPAQKVMKEAKKRTMSDQTPRTAEKPSPPPPVLLGKEIIYKSVVGQVPSNKKPEALQESGAKLSLSHEMERHVTENKPIAASPITQVEPTESLTVQGSIEPRADVTETVMLDLAPQTGDEISPSPETEPLLKNEEIIPPDQKTFDNEQPKENEVPANASEATNVGVTDMFDSMLAVMDDLLVEKEPDNTVGNDKQEEQANTEREGALEASTTLPELPEEPVSHEPTKSEELHSELTEDSGIVEGVHTPSSSISNSVVADILTPETNRTPSRRAYQLLVDSKLKLARTETKEREKLVKEKGPVLPIDILNDIEVEVFVREIGDDIAFSLERRAHPMERGSPKSRGEEIDLQTTEKYGEPGEERVMIYVERADKGVYILKIKNTSKEAFDLALNVMLYRGRDAEKKYNLQGPTLKAHEETSIRFLIPEAVFWDEKEYFTGEIENSGYVTKFNAETGLVWKEKKGF